MLLNGFITPYTTTEAQDRYWLALNRAALMGARVSALEFSQTTFGGQFPTAHASVTFSFVANTQEHYSYQKPVTEEEFDREATNIEKFCDMYREAYWVKEAGRWQAA